MTNQLHHNLQLVFMDSDSMIGNVLGLCSDVYEESRFSSLQQYVIFPDSYLHSQVFI